jgi:uncharacterized RDD family membrane protein YckC
MGEMATTDEKPGKWPMVVPQWDVHDDRDHKVNVWVGFAFDIVLHLIGFGIVLALVVPAELLSAAGWTPLLVMIGVYAAVSFAHLVLFQWVFQRTLGKALCRMRVVRADTRGRATLWGLTVLWLVGVFLSLLQLTG